MHDRVRTSKANSVCRLKGGDPFVFGRGGEEILAHWPKTGLPYEVVPGISAANGCAASAGIPLTHRDVSGAVTLVTGRRAAGSSQPDWKCLAGLRHTLVIYMGIRQIEPICDALIRYGRAAGTPAALIENGTTDQQRVVGGTLKNIAARAGRAGIGAPAILIAGEVVDHADKLRWVTEAVTNLEHHAAGGF